METIVMFVMLILAAPLQRIETQYLDRAKVTRVETMMNHLTVIELAEPVTLAAAGSPAFKIERRDNRVFIQPLEDGASTNLFVWTGSGRWNYELVPATSVDTMHFVIDQQSAPPLQTQNVVAPPAASTPLQSFAEEMLLFSKPIRKVGARLDSAQVEFFITDVYRKDDQLFVRYVIDNRTAAPYMSSNPEVFVLESAHSPTSFHVMRYSQVGTDIAEKIRGRRQTRIITVDCEAPLEPVSAGEKASGILILQMPKTFFDSEPAVLKFVFSMPGDQPASLTLVL